MKNIYIYIYIWLLSSCVSESDSRNLASAPLDFDLKSNEVYVRTHENSRIDVTYLREICDFDAYQPLRVDFIFVGDDGQGTGGALWN